MKSEHASRSWFHSNRSSRKLAEPCVEGCGGRGGWWRGLCWSFKEPAVALTHQSDAQLRVFIIVIFNFWLLLILWSIFMTQRESERAHTHTHTEYRVFLAQAALSCSPACVSLCLSLSVCPLTLMHTALRVVSMDFGNMVLYTWIMWKVQKCRWTLTCWDETGCSERTDSTAVCCESHSSSGRTYRQTSKSVWVTDNETRSKSFFLQPSFIKFNWMSCDH